MEIFNRENPKLLYHSPYRPRQINSCRPPTRINRQKYQSSPSAGHSRSRAQKRNHSKSSNSLYVILRLLTKLNRYPRPCRLFILSFKKPKSLLRCCPSSRWYFRNPSSNFQYILPSIRGLIRNNPGDQ